MAVNVRVTQTAVEILIDQDPTVRNTQEAVEILIDQDPSVRVTQAAVEILLDTDPLASISQAVREIILDTDPNAQISQTAREVIISVDADARISQVVREIIIQIASGAVGTIHGTGTVTGVGGKIQVATGTIHATCTVNGVGSTGTVTAADDIFVTQANRIVPTTGEANPRVTEAVRVVPTTGETNARITEAVRVVPTTGETDGRITQANRVVVTDGAADAQVTQSVRLVIISARNETEFLPEFQGTFGPLIWIEFEDPTDHGQIHVFSQVDLNDPASYYFGFKLGTMLSVDRVTRALSNDDDGSLEGQQFGVTFSDVDRYWRQIIGRDDLERIIINKNVKLRMISNVGRLAQEVPRTVALGIIRSYSTQ